MQRNGKSVPTDSEVEYPPVYMQEKEKCSHGQTDKLAHLLHAGMQKAFPQTDKQITDPFSARREYKKRSHRQSIEIRLECVCFNVLILFLFLI